MGRVNALVVQRTDLREALKYLKQFVHRKQSSEICLAFQHGAIVFQMGAVSAKALAEGAWLGSGFCSALVVLALLEGLPDEEQVQFTLEADRLRVGSLSFPCRWVEDAKPPVTLPIGASLLDYLRYRLEYSEAELSRSGLTQLVRQAEDKRDVAIRQAVKALKPFGIGRQDLLDLLEARLRGEPGTAKVKGGR
jgi:hypothetical protein